MNHKFLRDIHYRVHGAIDDAIHTSSSSAWCEYVTDCGTIFVNTNSRNEISVSVYHHEEEKKHPNIERAIYDSVPNWEEVESLVHDVDEFDRNGFGGEQDFINYKYF